MTAYQRMRLEDLIQREQVNGETLSPKERRELNTLDNQARVEWEAAEPPKYLGGDYPDVF